MQAIQYVRSIPRYFGSRLIGRYWSGYYTSGLACIRLANIDAPALPTQEWVRVQPLLSGICGSDLATITAQGSTYFSAFTSFPFVLGHEVVGEVVEKGNLVQELAKGMRVVLEPPLGCEVRGLAPPCPPCRQGRAANCENITRGLLSAGIQTGYCRDTGGGWSGGFVAHQRQLHPVPEALSNEAAVLIEPFSCALHAVVKARLHDSMNVVVVGCGTMGLLTIAAVRATGSSCHLIATAKYPHQNALARALGADVVLPSSPSRHLYSEIARNLQAKVYKPQIGKTILVGGADVVFECIGSAPTIDDALRFARSRGLVLLVGMPAVPKSVDWTSIWYKELAVVGSYTSERSTFELAIKKATEFEPQLKKLVGGRFFLKQYKAAFECALHTGRSRVIKTVFQAS
ncbi:MAG: alcohol dehydrogenase catalytic domain-containing protein [Acidobacteria bacterium]|nr:alcohol dehydrogenase catalytic domain-containing protein [Acidobacteriota bacterium]